jgi:hypothetical protein
MGHPLEINLLGMLPWQPDFVNTGERRRRFHHVPHVVHTLLERSHLCESRDIHGHNRLPRIAWRFGVHSVVDHVPAKRRAVQSPGKQTDHKRQPISFRPANGNKKTLARALRIGQGFSFAVDHPAFRHRLATLRFQPDLAKRGVGRGHVQSNPRMSQTRHSDGDGIGAEQDFGPAPRRQ